MQPNTAAGRVTLGEFDGKHPCIAAATTAEKVHTLLIIFYRNEMLCENKGMSCNEHFAVIGSSDIQGALLFPNFEFF